MGKALVFGRVNRLSMTLSRITIVVLLLLMINMVAGFGGTLSANVRAQLPPLIYVYSDRYGSSNVTDTSLLSNSQVTFEVKITGAPSFNGYEFFLYYDPAVLQPLSIDARTGTLFNNPFKVQEDLGRTPGTLREVVVNLGSASSGGDGVLCHLNFLVLTAGVSPLVLAAGIGRPSDAAQSWTRINLGIQPYDVETADGYFKNVSEKSGPFTSFTFSPSNATAGQLVSFNATSSYDSDNFTITSNGIARYVWDFGDGGGYTTSSPITTHLFATGTGVPFVGNFSVRVTVTDSDDSFIGIKTELLTISPNPAHDVPPIASFTFTPTDPVVGQTVQFNGFPSFDPDGTIVGNVWNFGDGSSGVTGGQVSHSFSTVGSFPVTLTVRDNAGLVGNMTQVLTVRSATDLPPIARFTFSPPSPTVGTSVFFDGSLSYDPDGFVQSWAWNFGDGSSLTFGGAFVSHNFGAPGNYSVSLTVSDNFGLANSTSLNVPVRPRMEHDVGILFVNVQKPVIVSGESVGVYAGLVNNGLSSEVVEVTVYYDSHVATSRTGISLPVSNSTCCGGPFLVFLTWDTKGVPAGNYTVSASVFLTSDQNLADNNVTDGPVTILPPPTLTLSPDSGGLGTQVVAHGSNFPTPQYGPSELFITFDDQFMGFAFPKDGAFNFTFNVPHADPARPHQVKALDVSSGLTEAADFHVLPGPQSLGTLGAVVDVGPVYFPGDSAVVYVLTSLNGSPVSSGVQLQIQLIRPDGSGVALSAVSVSTGLYKATYTVPRTGSTGTYAIVATISQNGQKAVALGSFEVKPPWIMSQSGRTTTTGLALVATVSLVAFASWKGYRGRRKEGPVPF